MVGTGLFTPNSALALWQASSGAASSEDFKLVLAVIGVAAILLWESWPRLQSRWMSGLTGKPILRYAENGRSGVINFDDGRGRFDMYWEFGGGNALVVIDVPTEAEWAPCTGIPVVERPQVLQYIAKQVIQDKTLGNKRYEIIPGEIVIFE